jgi:hypothetical protein
VEPKENDDLASALAEFNVRAGVLCPVVKADRDEVLGKRT